MLLIIFLTAILCLLIGTTNLVEDWIPGLSSVALFLAILAGVVLLAAMKVL